MSGNRKPDAGRSVELPRNPQYIVICELQFVLTAATTQRSIFLFFLLVCPWNNLVFYAFSINPSKEWKQETTSLCSDRELLSSTSPCGDRVCQLWSLRKDRDLIVVFLCSSHRDDCERHIISLRSNMELLICTSPRRDGVWQIPFVTTRILL